MQPQVRSNMINRLFYVFHGVTNWLFHRECRRAYSIVYGWYEEKRDEATARLVENIDLKERLQAGEALLALEKKVSDQKEQFMHSLQEVILNQSRDLDAIRNERDAAREALREAQALGKQAALNEITHAGLQLEIQKHEPPTRPARRKKMMEVPPA